MLNISFAGTKCLTISANRQLSNLLASILSQVGISEVIKDCDMESAQLNIRSADFNLIICAGLDEAQYLSTLSQVRNHVSAVTSRTPVICISEVWKSEHINSLRDAGVSTLATFPLNMRNILKQITRALNDTREFVINSTYRGPCRRRSESDTFKGPFRRSTDSAGVHYGSTPSKPDSVAPSAPAATSQSEAIKPPPLPRHALPSYSPKRSTESGYSPVAYQTDVTISGAVHTARDVFALFANRANRPSDPQALRALSTAIERWLNLMHLVTSRITSYGCNAQQLDGIKQMRETFHDHIIDYIQHLISEIITNCERWLASGKHITAHMRGSITQKMIAIDGLLIALDEPQRMDEILSVRICMAREYLVKIEAQTEGGLVLTEFNKL